MDLRTFWHLLSQGKSGIRPITSFDTSPFTASLAGDLDTPLRLGIGIHAGPAIVGEMGYARAMSVTAVGDAVNTASRLETMTKDFDAQLVVSEDAARHAGVDLSGFPSQTVEVRGRRANRRKKPSVSAITCRSSCCVKRRLTRCTGGSA